MLSLLIHLFSLGAILCSLLVISSTNPVHSIVNMIFAFLNSVGLFLLLGVDFIGIIYIIVYVGAIAILFLFVVMMLNVRQIYQGPSWKRTYPVALLIGTLYLMAFGLIGTRSQISTLDMELTSLNPLLTTRTTIQGLGEMLYKENDGFSWLLVISLILLVGMIGSILLALKDSHEHV